MSDMAASSVSYDYTGTSGPETPSTFHGLHQLYPALIQVFVVIFSGYVCGRSGMISEKESEGLNTFVSRFALPCMLFRAMATLDFSQVNWTLMSCVLISKSVVFFIVLLLTMLVSSRPIKYGRAGIFAITATQSNDFALGFPIIEALYRTSHPELPQYLYLFAPVSLIILNPIGFCLLELEKGWAGKDQRLFRSSKLKFLYKSGNVLKGILFNPINFMTFVGVFANFALKQKIPPVFDGVLATFSAAFSSAALFFLGLKMVGRVAEFSGFRLVVPLLLILAKLLFLPLITQAVTSQLQPAPMANDTQDYSNFGFLYGSIPAAPTVFVFATQYGQEVDTIGTVLVLSTFLSGPWMFISAQMLSIQATDLSRAAAFLSTTQFQVGVLGIAGSIWVMIVLILNGRCCKVPHFFTMGLLASQFMACLGMLFWQLAESSGEVWHYIEFTLFLTGVLSTRTWTAALSLVLWLQNTKHASVVQRRKGLFTACCFGVPVVVTVVVVTLGTHSRMDANPAFHYGRLQVIFSAVLLSVTLTVSTVCLVLGQIARRQQAKSRTLRAVNQSGDQELLEFTPSARLLENVAVDTAAPESSGSSHGTVKSDREDLMEVDLTSSSSYDTAPNNPNRYFFTSQKERQSLMEVPTEETASDVLLPDEHQNHSLDYSQRSPSGQDPLQYNRHVVLVLCLTTSMLVGLFVCFWRIFVTDSSTNGIFIELEFLDGVLMFGQSLFVFAIFGLDMTGGFLQALKRFMTRLTRTQAKI